MKTLREIQTSGKSELSRDLKIQQPRLLPRELGLWEKNSQQHKNLKLEENFEIGHNPQHQCFHIHLGLRILRGACEKYKPDSPLFPPPAILIHHILNYPQKVLFFKRDLYYLGNVRKIPLDDGACLLDSLFIMALHEPVYVPRRIIL